MPRTRLQLDADRHAASIRRRLAEDLRTPARGCRREPGRRCEARRRRSVDPHEDRGRARFGPRHETYARLAAALGADLASRVYPQTGPRIHDRHQVRMAEVVIGALHSRWRVTPEVAVRRPVRGWIDLALEDPARQLVVATELESDLRRIEQLIRWSAEKADAIGAGSRLLVVRWTRANRRGRRERAAALARGLPGRPEGCARVADRNGRVARAGADLGADRPRPIGAGRVSPRSGYEGSCRVARSRSWDDRGRAELVA